MGLVSWIRLGLWWKAQVSDMKMGMVTYSF